MSRGFSIIELLIVLTVITILMGISLFYLSAHQRLYRPDEEAEKLIDIFQEARQRALTQRETIRVEIDLSSNMASLIDENDKNGLVKTVDDDKLIRSITLVPQTDVKLTSRPPDITTDPPEPMTVPIAQFKPSVYPPSSAHNVCTFRFKPNGTVVDAGTDGIGSNSTLTGATLFVWSAKPDNPSQSEIARAITIVGGTGSVRYWEYNRTVTDANKWKDSRRTSIYGGTGSNSNTP